VGRQASHLQHIDQNTSGASAFHGHYKESISPTSGIFGASQTAAGPTSKQKTAMRYYAKDQSGITPDASQYKSVTPHLGAGTSEKNSNRFKQNTTPSLYQYYKTQANIQMFKDSISKNPHSFQPILASHSHKLRVAQMAQ